MAKFDALTIKRWHNKALQWMLANCPETLPNMITTGRDAWAVAHRCGITEEAYRDCDVTDAHIQTALKAVFPNAIFKDKKRY